jgi:2-keto-4-pentenoate hydratase/2-oxohepta-3-ene-1,7-dioic acid hydratase in catechol pathway
MKLIRFKNEAHPQGCIGKVDGETVTIMTGCMFDELIATEETLDLSSISDYQAPLNPVNVIAIGANYVDHCKECDAEPPTLPLVFIKTTNSVTAHDKAVTIPKNYPDEVDYEGELAVIIGKTASYVSEAEAMDYVFGYTCANDVSARDVQLKIDAQWARGKSFDTFCPLGPCIETDIKNVQDLHIKTRLNGEEVQNQPVSDMIFSIPRIISHLSAGITLAPGTVILTGTPAGVGMARGRFLQPGDVVEVEVDNIGILKNTVKLYGEN